MALQRMVRASTPKVKLRFQFQFCIDETPRCQYNTRMNTDTTNAPAAPRRSRSATRDAVLQAAGRVFAERGYTAATSKEICEAAGANSAAVNYHFGSKEGLYAEVLREAHQQISSLEELDAIASSAMPPAEKLRALLARLMHTALHAGDLWGIKIFLRELADPSPLALKNVTTVALPKALKVRAIIEEASGLPAGSPQLQWAAGLALIPCIAFILFPGVLKTLHFPDMPQSADALLDAMHCYISGGLAALRAREEGAGQDVGAD